MPYKIAEHEKASERVVFMARAADIEAIDDWGVSAGMRSRSEAIRTLVAKGLEVQATAQK